MVIPRGISGSSRYKSYLYLVFLGTDNNKSFTLFAGNPSKEIKSLGDFDVIINLHPEVQTQIVIKVVPQEEAK